MPVPLRVLFVDESASDVDRISHELARGGYEVTWRRIDSAADLQASLAAEPWDLVVSDYQAGGAGARETLAWLAANAPDTPVLIVAACAGEDAVVDALRHGAGDFIVVERLERLLPAVDREVRAARARRDRADQGARLLPSYDQAMLAFEALGSAIWVLDPATSVARWTRAVNAMLGRADGSMESDLDDFRRQVHADDVATFDAMLAEAVDSGTAARAEFRVVSADGRDRWIASESRLLKDEAGVRATVAALFIDVTELKARQQRRHQDQKLDSLARLAGTIAHDFNNVLTAILGFSELMLEDTTAGDERSSDLREIKSAADGGRRLTQQLLTFAGQERGQLAAVDPNALVTAARGVLAKIAGEQVALVMTLRAEGTVWVDKIGLGRALEHLASNARDAMPFGGRLRIETANTPIADAVAVRSGVPAGDYIVLAVGDTGAGMSAETQARLFEPFFTTKPNGEGDGIGLATVYGIVRQARGFVEVDTAPGQGTTFRLYFPRQAG